MLFAFLFDITGKMLNRRYASLLLLLSSLIASHGEESLERITIDCGERLGRVSSTLHGTCLEDLNCEIYGGLYGQLIYGEAFEEPIPDFAFLKNFSAESGEWRIADSAGELSSKVPDLGFNGKTGDFFFCGTLETEPTSLGSRLTYQGAEFEDGAAEVELFSIYPGAGGLIFNITDENGAACNSYEIFVSDKNNVAIRHRTVSLGALSNPKVIKKIPSGESGVGTGGVWIKLRVELTKRDGISIYLDGKKIFSDPSIKPLSKGKVGLGAQYVSFKFRNFKLEYCGERAHIEPGKEKISEPVGVSGKWSIIPESTSDAKYEHAERLGKKVQIMSCENGGVAGILNSGMGGLGMNLKKGVSYEGFLVLKAEGNLSVEFRPPPGEEGGAIAAAKIDVNAGEPVKSLAGAKLEGFVKCPFRLVPSRNLPNASFAIKLSGKGKAELGFAHLVSSRKWRGEDVREDIAEKLAESGIKFIRMGGTMVNNPNYKFSSMIGSPEERPVFEGFWYKYASLGFAIEEFVRFSKALGTECVFAVNMEQSPAELADMIEYLNGDPSTKMGALRAANGHKKPYGIKYVQLGNEEIIGIGDPKDYDRYIEKFKAMASAMREKDPDIVLINGIMWKSRQPEMMEKVFKALDGISEYWDIHVSSDGKNGLGVDKLLRNVRALFKKWNPDTQMKCAILEENGQTHSLGRALGHAATMNSVRRHADFVMTSCPANALEAWEKNINGWSQGQIFFTNDKVWGMPPFYAQKMETQNILPNVIKTAPTGGDLDTSAAISDDGSELAVYIVNFSAKPVKAQFDIKNSPSTWQLKKMTSLSADTLDAENTPDNPMAVYPVSTEFKAGETSPILPPLSYSVLRFSRIE